MKLTMLFLLFIIYSFVGWILEVIYAYYTEKKVINRGFLIGPYCPIYGISCVLMLLLLKKYEKDILILFIMSMLICSVLEYLTSYVLEKLFNARWWDYSDRKYNINGRVCIEMLIPFGLLGVFMIKILNPFVMMVVSGFSNSFIEVLSIVLMVIFASDCILSFLIIKKIKKPIYDMLIDNTEEITTKIKDYIYQYSKTGRRLMKSFPNVKFKKRKTKVKKDSSD